MSQYLEKAAELIARAAQMNERNFGQGSEYPLPTSYQANVLRLADAYAALAAVEHGQVPASLVTTILNALPDTLPDTVAGAGDLRLTEEC
jgi:hypothetical protein